jgi:hypothetical protein
MPAITSRGLIPRGLWVIIGAILAQPSSVSSGTGSCLSTNHAANAQGCKLDQLGGPLLRCIIFRLTGSHAPFEFEHRVDLSLHRSDQPR